MISNSVRSPPTLIMSNGITNIANRFVESFVWTSGLTASAELCSDDDNRVGGAPGN